MPTDKSDFLKAEYETAVDLVKYYDGRHFDFVKFASGLSAAVSTAVFGFYGLSDAAATVVWTFLIFVSVVTGVSLLSIFLAMLQNRVYFVFPGRQANSIRAYFFRLSDPPNVSGPVNQLYTSTNFPVYKPDSSHTFQLVFVAFQTAVFFGVAAYALAVASGDSTPVKSGMIWAGVVAAVLMFFAHIYLLSKNNKDADQAVHRSK